VCQTTSSKVVLGSHISNPIEFKAPMIPVGSQLIHINPDSQSHNHSLFLDIILMIPASFADSGHHF